MSKIEALAFVYDTSHPLGKIIVVQRALSRAIKILEDLHKIKVIEKHAATLVAEVAHDILS